MDKTQKIIVGMVFLGMLFTIVLLMNAPSKRLSVGGTDINRSTIVPSNTSVSCGTSSTLVVATSSARQSLDLVNDSANTIYVSIGVAAVGSNGRRLNAQGGSYSMDSNALYTGAVYCIASSSSMMTISENQN